MGVSVDDAYTRLQVQVDAGQVESELAESFPESFGGLWLEQTPEFTIRVGVVGEDVDGIEAYLESSTINSLTSFVTVDHPYQDLESWANSLLESTDTDSGMSLFDLSIDVPENRIVAISESASDSDQLEEALPSLVPDADTTAFEFSVGELAASSLDIYAGLAITTCASGFSVRSTSSSARGASTAGHCTPSQSYSGHVLTMVAERVQGSQDVEWRTIPVNDTLRPWAFDGIAGGSTPYYRVVTGTLGRSGQPIGALVCGYGKATAYRCDRIVSKSFAPSYVPSALSTFIVLHNDNAADISEPGDSGGPWFSGGTAYGIDSGQIANDAVYMAINYISALSIAVLT